MGERMSCDGESRTDSDVFQDGLEHGQMASPAPDTVFRFRLASIRIMHL